MSIENNVQLIGNLGNDPETRYTQNGTAVTTISLATTSKRKDRDGNAKEETQWHRCVCFGKLAEIAAEYLRKGSMVSIQGTIRYGKYEKDGVTRYTTDILFDEMKMLGGKPDREREAKPDARKPAAAPTTTGGGFSEDFSDDDIPF